MEQRFPNIYEKEMPLSKTGTLCLSTHYTEHDDNEVPIEAVNGVDSNVSIGDSINADHWLFVCCKKIMNKPTTHAWYGF